MQPSDTATPTATATEESARWICRIQSGEIDPDNCDDLKAWLKSDSRNAQAFRRMVDVYSRTAVLESGAAGHARTESRQASPPPLRWVATATASVAVVLAVVLMSIFGGETTETAVGERRLVNLDDGSSVHLNVNSSVRVHYGREQRTVDLRKGEVIFDVASEDPRPFVVATADSEVTVTGTAFQVSRYGDVTDVLVLEGTVNVAPRSGDSSVALSPGEGARVDGADLTRYRSAHPERATSWRNGWLYLEDVPVSELVARLDRQFYGKIRLDDAALAESRISVAVRLSDRRRTFERLESLLPLTFDELPGERFVVRSSP